MKKILLNHIIFLLLSISISAQKFEDNVTFNVEDTIFLPHYGQNEILDSIIKFTMGDQSKQNCLSEEKGSDCEPFQIPVKIWVYHNNGGIGDNDALSIANVETLFNEVNSHFANNNTGIRFYLKCEIEHVSSTQYNTIDSNDEFRDMITTYHEPRALNWHLIKNSSVWGGTAQFPWYEHNFNFAVAFGGILNDSKITTTVHEIGHTLGLLHTHENTRGIGNFNGDASNCYQESVSRDKDQGWGCVSTIGKTKCSINGDALCDTEAAPNTGGGADGANVGNELMDLNNSIDCNYVGGGTDNWGDAWNPPTKNYMSYLEIWTCREKFTPNQIAVMQNTVLRYMREEAFPWWDGAQWYNLNFLTLSGIVNSDDNITLYSPQIIEVARENDNYTINAGANVVLYARERISLLHGFHAKPDANFSATVGEIIDCNLVYSFGDLYLKNVSSTIIPIENIVKEATEKSIRLLKNALNGDYSKSSLKGKDIIENKNLFAAENTIKIFPNPNNGIFTISINSSSDQEFNIEILSIEGKRYYKNLVRVENTKTIEVDITHLNSGIYVLRVFNDKTSFVERIVRK